MLHPRRRVGHGSHRPRPGVRHPDALDGDFRGMSGDGEHMSSTTTAGHITGPHRPAHAPEGTRRDFLGLVTGAATALGTAAIAWTLIDSMNPAADVIAAGAP